jgi:catalase
VIAADKTIAGGPSVLFDAVVLCVSPEGAIELGTNPAALDFVRDAHAHCKFVGYDSNAGLDLVVSAGVEPDDGYVDLATGAPDLFIDACRSLRFWGRDATLLRYPSFDLARGIKT